MALAESVTVTPLSLPVPVLASAAAPLIAAAAAMRDGSVIAISRLPATPAVGCSRKRSLAVGVPPTTSFTPLMTSGSAAVPVPVSGTLAPVSARLAAQLLPSNLSTMFCASSLPRSP
ncbi:hypothetical protein D3C72_1594990 [compost metagenome]